MKINQILHEGYVAYEVPNTARDQLAKRFPPKYPEFIGHHITSVFGVSKPTTSSNAKATIKIMGYAQEDGLEAFVVTVNGQKRRSDGKRYHITWSLDRAKGKKPVQSNELIERGFKPVDAYEFVAQLQYFD